MQNTAFAGAAAPRLFILRDLFGDEAARLDSRSGGADRREKALEVELARLETLRHEKLLDRGRVAEQRNAIVVGDQLDVVAHE